MTKSKRAVQLAKSIMLVAGIPDGDSIVQVFGKGSEENNLEAISYWVGRQNDLISQFSSANLVEELVERLRSRMELLTIQDH